jgi:hypothetical protein
VPRRQVEGGEGWGESGISILGLCLGLGLRRRSVFGGGGGGGGCQGRGRVRWVVELWVVVLVMADWEGEGERRTYSNGCAELADSSAERKIKATVCISSLD